MKLAKALFLFSMVLVALTCASCTTTKIASTANYALSANVTNQEYSWGTYKAKVNTSIFLLDKAVRRACARAHLTKSYHAYRTTRVCYKYQDIDHNSASITIATLEKGTEVTIRNGLWGDEESSMLLMVAIDEELKLLMSQPGAADEQI